MTLVLAGYRFGKSNHAVYLIDALRHSNPNLLANDWWTQSTLQYHFVFTRISAWLIHLGWIEPAFLAGYVALAILMHVAWRRITLDLGGDDSMYLLSVVFFQLLGAGTGLGMYQFLQDSSFLPSNIANVAMLWGVCFWIGGRATLAGLALGLAGLFHLNHALVGIGLFAGLMLLGRRMGKREILGAVLTIALSLPAIVPTLKAVAEKTSSLPLPEFVSLYVRLRHPHHYDPSSWPASLWLSFLVPLAISAAAYRKMDQTPERCRAADAFVLFCAMLAIGLFGAGIFYVSEPLIQMSLYRFSIFPKLLSCIATAWLVARDGKFRIGLCVLVAGLFVGFTAVIAARVNTPEFLRTNAFALWLISALAFAALIRPRVIGWGRELFGILAASCVVVCLILSWHKLGIVYPGSRGDDSSYIALCNWARRNTPADAVFVVPPDEESFRLHAQRAIVVNFKNVPQLSGELGEWRDRLQSILALPDIRRLPRPFFKTLDAIRLRYAQLSTAQLVTSAKNYHARFVVSVRPLDTQLAGEPLFSTPDGKYFLYELAAAR